MLQKLQHVQTIVKGADNLHLAVLFNQPAQFLLCQEFVFNNDDFHNITPAQSNNVACEATGVRWLGM